MVVRYAGIVFGNVVPASESQRVVIAHLTLLSDGLLVVNIFKVLLLFDLYSRLLSLVGLGVAVNVPRVVDHQSEVVIIIDATRNVFVIFNEFLQAYFAISLSAFFQIMVSFESLKEL
jgi:hypothetical protein